jgi:hypothetical protein
LRHGGGKYSPISIRFKEIEGRVTQREEKRNMWRVSVENKKDAGHFQDQETWAKFFYFKTETNGELW